MTYDSRAKSEKSIRISANGKDDVFTSMRNILNKEEAPLSQITSKNNNISLNAQKTEHNS